MAVLLDTDILLRLVQPHHPDATLAEQSLGVLRSRGEILNVVSQNLIEFWAVATRPSAENGLGLSVGQAQAEIEAIKRLFKLLPELPLQHAWERLVMEHAVSGKRTHDAHLAAAMIVNRIGRILTFNKQDFVRYPEFSVLDPKILAKT